jgi:D-sorbitol dehydrogenase (acceptor)
MFLKSIPLGRIEQPEDVAAVAVFLVSSEADCIMRQTVNVDGGNWPS